MSAGRGIAGAVAGATAGIFPAFLTGAVAVQLEAELAMTRTQLGLAFALAFGGAALFSAPMGRLAERLGPSLSLRLGCVASSVLLGTVAAAGTSVTTLLVLLALTGVNNALVQPAANLLLTRAVPPERRGLAFGIKQSSIPTATMLSGVAVPLLAIRHGFRAAYAAAALFALVATFIVPGAPPAGKVAPANQPASRIRLPMRRLVLLAVAIFLGATSAGCIGSFLATAAVEAGVDPAAAGWLLVIGSACGIVTRLGLGVHADRVDAPLLPRVATLLVLGAGALLTLAVGNPWLYWLATPFAFACGWGWPGLFNLAVVRLCPEAPAAATGVTQTGTYSGVVLGPLAYGIIAEHLGTSAGWSFAATVALIAAVVMVVAGRQG